MFQVHSQHIDSASGFHVIELRDGQGNKHLVQIAIGHDSCPLCGHITQKDNLGTIDPKAMVNEIVESLNRSREAIASYSRKHGLTVT
ncbi:MAG: hypothetical protein KGL39_35665 [Patescibacteria group bacterium]|nr:hypothetical protein [Patescibacteria group bacterium]